MENGNNIKGSFVYVHYASPTRTEVIGLFTWDVSSFHTTAIEAGQTSKENEQSYAVSPDGKIIADLFNKQLALISRDRIQSSGLPTDNLAIETFLADGRIRLASADLHWERKANYKEDTGLTDTYYIFDPTTGQTTKNTVFLPNFETGKRESFTVQYSPDMKYILYRSKHDVDKSGYYVDKFTLFDLEKNEMEENTKRAIKNFIYYVSK